LKNYKAIASMKGALPWQVDTAFANYNDVINPESKTAAPAPAGTPQASTAPAATQGIDLNSLASQGAALAAKESDPAKKQLILQRVQQLKKMATKPTSPVMAAQSGSF
jgi:hypothetical protein